MLVRPTERRRAPGALRGAIAREQRSVLFGGRRRRRRIVYAWLVVPLALIALGVGVAIARAQSVAVGSPNDGRLVRGVQLPAAGPSFFTYDWNTRAVPNAPERRWATDTTVARTLAAVAVYWQAFPLAPRVGIADLSRPRGGPFGEEFGGLGHGSHQNGLDVDVLYPRRDRRETVAARPSQVDRAASQALVDAFVAAGAQYVFVGPRLGLGGPRRVVQPLVHHDDHMHVRFPG